MPFLQKLVARADTPPVASQSDCRTALVEDTAPHPDSRADNPTKPGQTQLCETILQNYKDKVVDRLDLSELLDLLQNCVAAFELTPSVRLAALVRLASIDLALASVSLHTPPSTPLNKRMATEREVNTNQFRVLESAEVPAIPLRSMCTGGAVAAAAPDMHEVPPPKNKPSYRCAWTERRFTKSKSAVTSSFAAGSPVDIGGAVYLPSHATESLFAAEAVHDMISDWV